MNPKLQTPNYKRLFGIIGYPLSHSFSQKYFTQKFERENTADCEFKNFSLENIQQLHSILTDNTTLRGLSVTIPHKQNIIPFLDEIDPAAKEIGAVNCVKIWQTADARPDEPFGRGRWKMAGYNTDVLGFEQSLKPLLKPHHTNALILGTGGAAKAVAYALKRMGINFNLVSRTKGNLSYSNLDRSIIEENCLIVNTTPLGMFPHINECPDIPYQFITSKHLLYDLTYNPEVSLFLEKGKEKGAQIKNGLEMLHIQAEKAWEIWNDTPNP